MFNDELSYFIANQEELVEKYKGQVLILRGKQVAGVYPSQLAAYIEGKEKFGLGNFMIQPCTPGPEAYTVTITPAFTCK
jgi:hypothetical protein